MLRDLIEIYSSYVQYLLLLVGIGPSPYPTYYSAPVDEIKYINLDFTALIAEGQREGALAFIPRWVPLDIRIQFILISIILPILVSWTGLLFLATKRFMLWFVLLNAGIFLLFIGLFIRLTSDVKLRNSFTEGEMNLFAYAGAATIGAMLIVAIIVYCYRLAETRNVSKRKRLAALRRQINQTRMARSGYNGPREGGHPDETDMAKLEAEITAEEEKENEKTGGEEGDAATAETKEETRKTLEQVMKEEVDNVNAARQLERFAFFVILAAVALLFLGLYNIPYVFRRNDYEDGTKTILSVIAGLFLFLSLVYFVTIILGFSYRGRKVLFSIRTFVRDNFVSILILFVTLMYVPSCSFIVQVYNCNSFQCSDHSTLPMERSLITQSPYLGIGGVGMQEEGPYVHSDVAVSASAMNSVSSAVSTASDFSSTTSASSTTATTPYWYIQNSSLAKAEWNAIDADLRENHCVLCDPSQFAQRCSAQARAFCVNVAAESRLERNRKISCDNMRNYFWPAGGIMFIAFVLATPVINFILTTRSTRVLQAEFPLDDKQSHGYTDEELFEEKVYQSDNVAKFIYDPFVRKYKHWRMLFLLQKLGIVVSSVFVIRVDFTNTATLGISMSLIIHVLAGTYVIVTRPFNRTVENALTIATQTVMTIACATGLPGTQNAGAPAGLLITVAIIIFVVPVISILVGALMTFQNSLKKEKDREDRVAKAQEKAQEEDDEDDEPDVDAEFPGGSMSNQDGSPIVPSAGGGKKVGFAVSANPPISPTAPVVRVGQTNTVTFESANVKASEEGMFGVGDSVLNHPWTGGIKSSLQQNAAMAGNKLKKQNADSSQTTTDNQFLNPQSHMPSKNVDDISPLLRPGAIPVWALTSKDARKQARRLEERGQGMKYGLTKPPTPPAEAMRAKKDSKPQLNGLEGRQRSVTSPISPTSPLSDDDSGTPKLGLHRAAGVVKKKLDPEVWRKARRLLLEKVRADAREAERLEEIEEKRQQEELDAINAAKGSALVTDQSFFVGGAVAGYDISAQSGVFTRAAPQGIVAKKKRKKKGNSKWDQLLEALKSEENREKVRRDLEAMEQSEHQGDAGPGGDGPMDESGSPRTGRRETTTVGVLGKKTQKKAEERIRKRLKQLYEDHLDEIKQQQQAVDFKINEDTIGVLQIFFFIGAIMSLLAFSWVAMGIYSRAQDYSVSTFIWVEDPADYSYPESSKYALLGHSNFTTFTQECCCTAFTEQSAGWPHYALDLERWVCSDGKVKEKVRRWTYVDRVSEEIIEVNGYSIRPMCGMSFNRNCTLNTNTTSSTVSLEGCNGWPLIFNHSVSSPGDNNVAAAAILQEAVTSAATELDTKHVVHASLAALW